MIAIASDFDGTLRLYGKDGPYVLDEDIRAIRAFQSAGGLFGICTGRPLSGLLAVLREEVHPDFLIVSSGAAVVDVRGEEPRFVMCTPVDPAVVRSLYRDYGHKGKMTLQTRGPVLSVGTPTEAMPEEIQVLLEDISEAGKWEVTALSLGTSSPEKAAKIAADMNERYGEYIRAFQNIEYLDIIQRDCSKGTGAAWIRRLFDVDHLYGIGDSFNDIPLLDAADTAVTFHRVPAEVREHADILTDSISGLIEEILAGMEKD